MSEKSEKEKTGDFAGFASPCGMLGQKGFTLVEILIAIFILAVGILGVIGVTTTVINGNSFSKRVTTATILAQEKMEELKGEDYASIASDGPDTVQSIYTRTCTVVTDTPAVGTKTIEVTVQFDWKGTTHDVTLKTIKAE